MTTIRQELNAAARFLSSFGLDSPREDAELILATVTRSDRAYLMTHPERPLTEPEQVHLWRWLQKRAHQYPIQYLRGCQEFFGREFLVSPDVLIPRPETELLIEVCLELLEGRSTSRVLDIGTGSGCIAITLLAEVPGLTAVATDIEASALKIAAANARRRSCSARLHLLNANIEDPLPAKFKGFDLVVSNPPYVAWSDKDLVSPSVFKFEPPVAVFAGATGLEVIEHLFRQAPFLLAEGGHLVIELGYDQSQFVSDLANKYSMRQTDLRTDLANLERCAVFQKA